MFYRASLISALVILIGEILFNTVLQWIYYHIGGKKHEQWKLQPRRNSSLAEAHLWWIPLLRLSAIKERTRHPLHYLLGTINLVIATSVCFLVVELSLRNTTAMYFDSEYSALVIALQFLSANVQQNVLEYYWHRAMHLPFFYARFHKLHHYYKSPEPFDDMMIHPLEALGYYCILFSPAVYLIAGRQIHVFAFIAYMIVNGIFGVLDHSGIDMDFFIYKTKFHDLHHSEFNCNYGFPFHWMDVINGTYRE